MQSNGTHVNRDCEVPADQMNYKRGERSKRKNMFRLEQRAGD